MEMPGIVLAGNLVSDGTTGVVIFGMFPTAMLGVTHSGILGHSTRGAQLGVGTPGDGVDFMILFGAPHIGEEDSTVDSTEGQLSSRIESQVDA